MTPEDRDSLARLAAQIMAHAEAVRIAFAPVPVHVEPRRPVDPCEEITDQFWLEPTPVMGQG